MNHGSISKQIYRSDWTCSDLFSPVYNNPVKFQTKAGICQERYWTDFLRALVIQSEDTTDNRNHKGFTDTYCSLHQYFIVISLDWNLYFIMHKIFYYLSELHSGLWSFKNPKWSYFLKRLILLGRHWKIEGILLFHTI